jgi:torulene dioxygenase
LTEAEAPIAVVSIKAPHAGELPTINPSYICRKHRYVYAISNRGLSTVADALCKTDTQTGDVVFWSGPLGHTPGEAIFIPKPVLEGEELEEDDGVLLSVVLDGAAKKSYLLCLDAKNMTELGRAECEFAVSLGFHGHHAKAVSC